MSHSFQQTAIPSNARQAEAPVAAIMRRIATELREEPRQGANTDEPEGARFIQISHTAAESIARELDQLATIADPFELPDDELYTYANVIAAELRRRMQKRDTQRVTLR